VSKKTEQSDTAVLEKSDIAVLEKSDIAVLEKEGKTQEPKVPEAKASEAPAPQPQAGPQITLDESNLTACYANFCRVSSTPEELILDLGLNPQPMARVDTTINISQRIILNHYTAKRMLSALSMALQRHEQAFGVLETDIMKRVKQQ
jgi:hypothetical protein